MKTTFIFKWLLTFDVMSLYIMLLILRPAIRYPALPELNIRFPVFSVFYITYFKMILESGTIFTNLPLGGRAWN
jgi:hypothetical protein